MKKFKGLKITVIVLLIILLSMVSFIGIYVQDKNQVKNILPEYILSRDLKGHRRIELKVNDEVKETKKYDESGNLITDDSITEVARTEETKVNSDEVLTKENFEESKKVLEKRLEKMQVTNYVIRQNEENGNIIIELPENDDTDNVVGQVSLQGKFEIVDKDTNEVLMTNDDLKSVQSRYGTTSSGTTAIVLNIQFNKYIFGYVINLEGSTSELDIEAVPLNKDAKVEISENAKNLIDGINKVEVRVIYNDVTTIYTITVYKNYKEEAKLNNININGYDLNFNKDILLLNLIHK